MDVEVEHPHVHNHRTGHRLLDLALPLAALFVSFVSILIAWHHGEVMQELVHQNEKLVEANSLPYVQLYGSNRNGGVSFNAVNAGVGPARIATAEVLVDGRPVQNLEQLLTACCKAKGSSIGTSTLVGRMMRAGDVIDYIDLPGSAADPESVAELDRARQADRIVTRLCYCSVFDDCWKVTSKDPSPVPAQRCEPPARAYKQ